MRYVLTFLALVLVLGFGVAEPVLAQSGPPSGSGSRGDHCWQTTVLKPGESTHPPDGGVVSHNGTSGTITVRHCDGCDGQHASHTKVNVNGVKGGSGAVIQDLAPGSEVNESGGSTVTVNGDGATINVSGFNNDVTVNGNGNTVNISGNDNTVKVNGDNVTANFKAPVHDSILTLSGDNNTLNFNGNRDNRATVSGQNVTVLP